MTIKRLFGCIVLCMPFLLLKAQSGNDAALNALFPIVPSANAASLGEYGEIPVSYFTGVPDISIPLYTIKGARIALPISLSYHAGGLRPDVHPGWVGNGWTLQAGGAITRKVNGMTDERLQSYVGTQGYYFNHADLAASTWSATATLKTVGVAYNQVLPPANPNGVQTPLVQANDVDTEPDEFDFNFLGYSGKFFLDQNGNWQVQSDKAFKVIFNPSDFVKPFAATAANSSGDGIDANDMVKTFGRFTLIDEQGNQYVFGSVDANNTAIEFSDQMIPTSGYIGASISATSWYLTQITSADGSEVINLSYVRGPFTSYIGYQYTAQQLSISGISQCSPGATNPGRGIFSGSVIAPVYLSSITMPSQNVSVSFANVSASPELNYNYQGSLANTYAKVYTDAGISLSSGAPSDFPSFYCYYTSSSLIPYYATNSVPPIGYNRFIWLELNSIRITNSDGGSFLRNINFSYNNSPAARLQLEAINITDVNNNSVEPNGQNYYSFGYNTTTSLPNYLTIYGDHWGFNNYNGSNNLASGYPSGANFFTLRNPDPTGVQTTAEILTSITYPTGGTTTFTYEPNEYSSWVDRTTTSHTPVASTGVGGGVRIRQITSTDQYNSTVTKNYYYVKGYTSTANISSLTSSGVLDSKPQYSFTTTGTTSQGNTFSNSYVTSNSVVPASSNSMGTYMGYSTVVEQRSDGAYTIYTYTNHDNGYGDQSPVNTWNTGVLRGYNVFNSMWFERGLRLDKKEFTNNDVAVSDESAAYTLTIPSNVVNAVNSNNITVCTYGNQGAYERDAYYMCYSPFLPTTKTRIVYSSDGSGNSYTSTYNLTYDQYKNEIQSQTTNSKGQTEITTTTYPASLATTDVNNPYMMMVNMNNVSAPVETRVNLAGNLTKGEIHAYQALTSNKIYCTGIYKYENSLLTPVSGLVTTAFNPAAGQLTMDPGYVQEGSINFDQSGNVSTITRPGNYPQAFLWDYNQQLLSAKVDNASNIYASSTSSVQTESMSIHMGLNLNTSYTQTIVISAAGPVTLSFTYAPNPGVAATAEMTYNLYGPTTASGTLCSATPTSTTSCGSVPGTVTISNVQPGTYSLVYDLTSDVGFQNYYGYTLTVSYPTNIYTTVAAKNDIGYTSFEYITAADLTYGTGNWTGISLSNIHSGSAVTGNYYYTISGSPLTKSGLNTATTYIVSYWSNSGPYTVTGSTSTLTGANIATGNWTYYEHTVTGTASVTVTGTGNIDELRIYPKGSMMTTYAHTPLVGLISECDDNNYITYYTYDTFNRLILVKDRDGNVLKEYQYNY